MPLWTTSGDAWVPFRPLPPTRTEAARAPGLFFDDVFEFRSLSVTIQGTSARERVAWLSSTHPLTEVGGTNDRFQSSIPSDHGSIGGKTQKVLTV